MKKAMLYLLALTLAFSALLSGCGEKLGTGKDAAAPTEPPKETVLPEETILPEEMMPDPADGEVRDSDGIITDGDSGKVNGATETVPESTAMPGTGMGKLKTGNTAASAARAKR